MGRRDERGSFRQQDYAKLRKAALASGQLWEDPEFPADSSSLYFDPSEKKEWAGASAVEWLRPKEICVAQDIAEDAALFVDGVSRDDVRQGVLGNCWFVSACAVLVRRSDLLDKVIPGHKSQDCFCAKGGYAGIFRFAFFRFGRWVEVCVDDRLPCRDGRLLFAHSKTAREFWCALLEKAFAKLNGCYEALIAGALSEALMNLSGGVPQRLSLANPPDPSALFFQIKEAADAKALIATAIAPQSLEEVEEVLHCGLVKGHSYAVTDVRQVVLDSEAVQMLRLQNPWGRKEWNGAWSDDSKEWERLSTSQRKELGLTFDEDGEFWMSWEDFRANFSDISLCHFLSTSSWSWAKRWYESEVEGAWIASPKGRGTPDDRAGGCPNFTASAHANPQFLIELKEEGELILSLIQKETERRKAAPHNLTIGIHVMRVESNRVYRIHQLMTAVGTSEYTNARAEYLHLKELKKGRYIIMPTTYAPGEEGQFLLRVFASEKLEAKELRLHKPPPPMCFACCRSKVSIVTRLTILSGENLVSKSGSREVDPYCIVSCEGSKSRTDWVGKDPSPNWNHSAVFWRRHPAKPLQIKVYDANYLSDSLLGKAELVGEISNMEKAVSLQLKDKEGKEIPGRLSLSVATYDDPFFI